MNRGPASLRVLQRVRALADAGRARVVLGNHELALLRTAWGARTPAPDDTFQDVLDAPDAKEWIDWIRGWPVAVVDRLGGQDFAMVHGAVAPAWSLAEIEQRARAIEARLRRSRRAAARLLAANPRGDGDAETADFTQRPRTVAVQAHERGQVEGGGEPRLTAAEQKVKAAVEVGKAHG